VAAEHPAATKPEWGVRENAEMRENAREALEAYAESLRFWNAPDDEHTRYQLRSLLDEAMDEAGL
jgi:hypothetical protein